MGVTYLLDTHVLLWMLCEPDRLEPGRRAHLASPESRLMVSAASAMEVATKTRLGRLEAGHALVPTWSTRLTEIAAEELPVSVEHALLAGSMQWDHRDPFDRLLVAQALTEGVPLVTVDPVMTQVPGLRVVDPRRSPRGKGLG
ncbi:MAG TPA: type II toxin-antitoxin system VapC family toxin [Propionicimonas sp.]|nr:type II toxin-antitoxin system VapC family toxin [Propionicimonas sp.]